MRMKSRIFIILILVIVAAWGPLLRAESPTPAMGQLRLFGRWDLRTPDRANTVNGGSYILARFTGPTVDANFDVSLNKPPVPTLTWRIDDGAWQESEVLAKMRLADGLPAGPHTLWLMVRSTDQRGSRWKAPVTSSVTFLGLDLPGGQLMAPLDEWDHPKLTIEFLGDSITEGVLVQAPRPGKTTDPWLTDALNSYSCQAAMTLGAQWRQVGFGGTGMLKKGSGGQPGAITTFNFFYKDCPRDGWQPDVVVVNQGTNDRKKVKPDAYAPLYAQYLAMIRQAYPAAKIVALRPFDGAEMPAMQQVVDQMHAAGDAKVYFIDTTGWYDSKPLHPNAAADKIIAAKLVDALQTTVLK
jgi:lysophospholipase L1-like esterase